MEFFEIKFDEDFVAKVAKKQKPTKIKTTGDRDAYGAPCANSQSQGFVPICAN